MEGVSRAESLIEVRSASVRKATFSSTCSCDVKLTGLWSLSRRILTDCDVQAFCFRKGWSEVFLAFWRYFDVEVNVAVVGE